MPSIRDTLSLAELQVALNQRGVPISLPQLRRFVASGDIAKQLDRREVDNSRHEFPQDALTALAAFLPEFERAGGKLPQAANMLRAFLHRTNGGGDAGGVGLVPVVPFDNLAKSPDMEQTAILRAILDTLRMPAQPVIVTLPPDDTLLDRQGAARLLACSPDRVSDYVKPVKGRRSVWKKSSVLAYIATL